MIERRRMSWYDEGSLFNELQWLVDGGPPYEDKSEEERKEAQELIDRYIEFTHEESDGLGEYNDSIYDRLTEAEIDSLEERLSQVEVVWLKEDWETADRLLAGVTLIAGYEFKEANS